MSGDDKLPIGHHLLELRKRLVYSAAAIVICAAVAFAFHQQILLILMSPAEGFEEIPNNKPIFTDITEFLGVAVKVSLLGGLFLALPFVLYQLVRFVAPGLSGTEKRYLYSLMPVSVLAFVAGAAFGYFVLFPPAVDFLLSFGSKVATPYIRIGNYVNLMITLLFWMGIVFETPVVLFFLSRIGVVSYEFLAKNRRYALVVAFVLGAIITPTFDPLNQSLVAIPIIVMYELGVWLSRIGGRKRHTPSTALVSSADDS